MRHRIGLVHGQGRLEQEFGLGHLSLEEVEAPQIHQASRVSGVQLDGAFEDAEGLLLVTYLQQEEAVVLPVGCRPRVLGQDGPVGLEHGRPIMVHPVGLPHALEAGVVLHDPMDVGGLEVAEGRDEAADVAEPLQALEFHGRVLDRRHGDGLQFLHGEGRIAGGPERVQVGAVLGVMREVPGLPGSEARSYISSNPCFIYMRFPLRMPRLGFTVNWMEGSRVEEGSRRLSWPVAKRLSPSEVPDGPRPNHSRTVASRSSIRQGLPWSRELVGLG